MKCNNWRCAQKPELKQTGWGSPHAVSFCPICKQKYYETTEGLSKEKPFAWPKNIKNVKT